MQFFNIWWIEYEEQDEGTRLDLKITWHECAIRRHTDFNLKGFCVIIIVIIFIAEFILLFSRIRFKKKKQKNKTNSCSLRIEHFSCFGSIGYWTNMLHDNFVVVLCVCKLYYKSALRVFILFRTSVRLNVFFYIRYCCRRHFYYYVDSFIAFEWTMSIFRLGDLFWFI